MTYTIEATKDGTTVAPIRIEIIGTIGSLMTKELEPMKISQKVGA